MTDERYQAEREQSLQLLRDYARIDPRTKDDWGPILKAYREAKNHFVFEIDFACDPELYSALLDAKVEIHAKHSFDLLMGAPESNRSDALIRITAMLCLAQTGANESALNKGWDQMGSDALRRIEIWKSEFSDLPEFGGALAAEIERSRKQQVPLPQSIDTQSYTTRTFEVQGRCAIEDLDGNGAETSEFIPAKLLGPVNAFCEQYLSSTRFDISDDGKHWLITQGDPDGNESDHLSELRGQLSDGWGGNLETYSVLVGSQKVYAGWDSETLRILSAVEPGQPRKTPRP